MFAATAGRHVLPGAARVIAVSDAERKDLRSLGVRESQLALVPNPIDEEEFAAPADAERFRETHGLGSSQFVLFLGKLTPRKGVDILARAFAELDTRGVSLVVAGNDMGSGRDIDGVVAGLGIASRVRRVGLLRGDDRRSALEAASVVVYPSREEVFGLVPLESLLSGTPVVVSGDSGCGEVIGRVGGGHIVPYGDVRALAGAIDAILRAPEPWRVRAGKAAARIRTLFGSAVIARQLEALYAEVCAAPCAPPGKALT